MKFKNPCLKCLVQACCSKQCKKLESFKLIIALVGILSLLFGIICSIVIPIIIWVSVDWSGLIKFMTISGGWCLLLMFLKLIVNSLNEYNNDWDFNDFVIFFIFGPTFIISIIIILCYELYARPNVSERLLI
jgi:hypothetical protein